MVSRTETKVEIRVKRHFWKILLGFLLVVLAWSMRPTAASEYPLKMEQSTTKEPIFLLHQIGDDLSEGIAVMDMNGDGTLDVTSGAYWYEAPDWARHKFREVKIAGEYVVNCGEFTIDVDEDGDLDIVGAGWQEDGIFWWENPGELGPIWEKHFITTFSRHRRHVAGRH